MGLPDPADGATKMEFSEKNHVRNYVNGSYQDHAPGVDTVPVTDPATGEVIAIVPVTTKEEVDKAVAIAKEAQKKWGAQTVKTRVQALFKLKMLMEMEEHSAAIVELIRKEHGKNTSEGKASLMKGIETVEWACSLPQMIAGRLRGESVFVLLHVLCWLA